MGSLALVQSLKDSVVTQANVKAIYGEPIAAQGKTIIPVAKIIYAYGGGAGTGGMGDTKPKGEGGGGGGGARAIPVGVIEAGLGGSYIREWISAAGLASEPNLQTFSGATSSDLYNGLIAPLTNASLAGVIWYQGEADASAGPARKSVPSF